MRNTFVALILYIFAQNFKNAVFELMLLTVLL